MMGYGREGDEAAEIRGQGGLRTSIAIHPEALLWLVGPGDLNVPLRLPSNCF